MNLMLNKMHVEIWSDVMCPFCYIGKRKFEVALKLFPEKENLHIVWRSFQLAPDMKTNPSKNINNYLAEHKGISLQEAKHMNEYVTNMAAEVGLTYHFEKAIVANSFNAHRFTHFAKAYGKQNEAEEKLFHAYFTDGKNTDDLTTLLQLAHEIGLDSALFKNEFELGMYVDEVNSDIDESHKLGIRGVPFFLFNRKLAISGAQDPDIFLKAITKAYDEWRTSNPESKIEIVDGRSCASDENCA